MKMSAFFLTLLTPMILGLSNPRSENKMDCPSPSNISVAAKTNNSISFDWDDCGCDFSSYQLFYEREGVSSQVFSTGNSQFTFTGLIAGTYDFYFQTECGSPTSNFVVVEDTIEY